MHVVATAGHVDHGKSTLVRALTGMEPDRWAEERRRGMTIDLGFAWTTLPGLTTAGATADEVTAGEATSAGGGEVAFVDVPGHERFVPTMLAGVGPVPAVLLVVAADEGWMPQTTEHAEALHALGVQHGLLVISRCDLADPAAVLADARARLSGTTLAGLTPVAVSAHTGAGLQALRLRLAEVLATLPAPDPHAPVRLWVDRSFSIRGSGTVVTGTLSAGSLRVGSELVLHTRAGERRTVAVRGLQTLGRSTQDVQAVARVALNLRGVSRSETTRGDALLSPGHWEATSLLDVRFEGDLTGAGTSLVLHVGSAAVAVHVRPLDASTLRLRLARPLPLAARDTALLRDPGGHRVLGRVSVLDADPPTLARRGAAAARARALAGGPERPDGAAVLRKRQIVRAGELRAIGAEPPQDAVRAGEWLVDAEAAQRLRSALVELVAEHRAGGSLAAGPGVRAVADRLGLPDVTVVAALTRPPLAVRDGHVVDTSAPPPMPPAVARAVTALREDLADRPFLAPEAARLRELGLGTRELAVAERSGALLRVSDAVVLLAGAEARAVEVLTGIPQPFSLSEARQALGTTRRVAVPLLELLDRRRLTRRLPDDRRTVARP